MKIIATIEARMTSTRLPGKILLPSFGKPMLEHMIERLRLSSLLDDVVVATTTNQEDDLVVELCERINCSYFRGSEEDVLLRVLETAKDNDADIIVQTTGDCPLIDPAQVDELIKIYMKGEYDYVANCTDRTFPDGFDIRIFSTDSLTLVDELTKDSPLDREHVSVYFPSHQKMFRCYNLEAEGEVRRPDLEVTLDEEGDYKLLDAVICALYPNKPNYSCLDVIHYLDSHKELLEFIKDIHRRGIS